MPFFPDCYDEWGLYKIIYEGDHKSYEMLFEGTEEEWARLKKGPMGTVLEEASNQVGETSNETL